MLSGSTDVGDVSWIVPTMQCMTACWALGTPFHTWQVRFARCHAYCPQRDAASWKSNRSQSHRNHGEPGYPTTGESGKRPDRLDGETYFSLNPDQQEPPRKG